MVPYPFYTPRLWAINSCAEGHTIHLAPIDSCDNSEDQHSSNHHCLRTSDLHSELGLELKGLQAEFVECELPVSTFTFSSKLDESSWDRLPVMDMQPLLQLHHCSGSMVRGLDWMKMILWGP